MKRLLPAVLIFIIFSSCRTIPAIAPADSSSQWLAHGRNGAGTRYLDGDINAGNVQKLVPAWTYHTGDVSFETDAEKKSAFEATPILVDNRLVVATPFNRVIAIDPQTGKELWKFDPHVNRDADYSEVTSRGVSTWLDHSANDGAPCRRRIIAATIDARMFAVDGHDGSLCRQFGVEGFIDLHKSADDTYSSDYQVTSPPAIIGDTIVVGSSIGDNSSVDLPRGVVRAYDARTGALRWSWDPIPHGIANRDQSAWKGNTPIRTGAANAWAVISVDEKRGLVFVPTSSPSPDYYGGERLGSNAHANSVVALHASDGSVAWSFQVVHHDLWDYDVAAEPMLITFMHDGAPVDAVAVGTKMGFIYLLDRTTGKPIFPVEERAVPASDVPGEEASPTQPFPTFPPPLGAQGLQPSEAWGLNAEDRDACRERIASMRSEGTFTPPSVRGTIVLPGNIGGVHWGGMSYDEHRHVLLVNTNNIAMAVRLIPRDRYDDERRHGDSTDRIGGEFSPMRGTPYGMHRQVLTSPRGIPCNAPPFGTLTAIDLDAKSVLWTAPLGTIPTFASMPGHEKLGSINFGGTLTTGGVVFAGAAMDEVLRAFDQTSGKLLWEHALPASAQAAPMTYRSGGRQFVVIAAAGHGKLHTKRGDSIVAFELAH